MEDREIVLGLAGNPNSGKTTLFNALTKRDRHVGNWPGVTASRVEGDLSLKEGEGSVVDLPGIYSLFSEAEDEKVARDFLLSHQADVLINIVDATNLERSLDLTVQLMEMRIPVLLVLNMMDEAIKREMEIDLALLERRLGIPVVAITATKKRDIERLKETVEDLVSRVPLPIGHIDLAYPEPVERLVRKWGVRLARPQERSTSRQGELLRVAEGRWRALRIIDGNSEATEEACRLGVLERDEVDQARVALDASLGAPPDQMLARVYHKGVQELCEGVVRRKQSRKKQGLSGVDRVVMHPLTGIPVFLIAMYGVFWLTLSVGGAFIDFFDRLVGEVFVDGLFVLLTKLHAFSWLIALLVEGVGVGIQTVFTFIPTMFFLFLALSLLEDSGYMARAAYVMDRFMRWMGLPGKAFLPMLVGFGCTVPAIMATRNMERRRDRFMTIFMVPFMSCGAKLPVYALFGAAFFGRNAGFVVFSLYVVGIVMALLTGLMLKKTLFKGEFSPFIMELPPYRIPRWKSTMRRVWLRLRQFLFKAGKVIVLMATILGALNSLDLGGGRSAQGEEARSSILSSMGRGLVFVFRPMGISQENWPAVVGLFTGILAKEVIVGTLNALYLPDLSARKEAPTFDFPEALSEAVDTTEDNLKGVGHALLDPFGLGVIAEGDRAKVTQGIEVDEALLGRIGEHFTPYAAYAYLLFVLIYFPCVAAMGAVMREIGKAYGAVLVGYLTILAWCVAVLFYQVTEGGSLLLMGIPLVGIGAIFASFAYLRRGEERMQAAHYF